MISSDHSNPDSLSQIKNTAIILLAKREYGKKELFAKLTQKYTDIDAIHCVLDSLQADNLQNDERYSEAFIRYKKSQGKGPLFIQQELKYKGIDSNLINSLVNSSEHDWYEQARQVYYKKFRSNLVDDHKDKAKRLRFMFSRGFGSEHVAPIFD